MPSPPSGWASALGSFFSFDMIIALLPGLVTRQLQKTIKNPNEKEAARLFGAADLLRASADAIDEKLFGLGFARR